MVKKITFLLMMLPILGFGQTTDLFFSEYGEGNSFNKYIEIYNGTGAAVDLSTYSIELYTNGGSTAQSTLALTGTLQNNSTYVIAHADAAVEITTLADVLNSNIVNFNGDDALVLLNNSVGIDIFGIVGNDPGTSWTVAGNTSATLDKVLYRKATVCSPTMNWTVSAGTDATDSQWEINALAFNATNLTSVIAGLGTHTANCSVGPCTVIPAPVATDVTICGGTTATLTATASETGSTLSWFDVATGGTAIGTGASFTTGILSTTTSFWVEEAITGCPESARTEIVVAISGTAPTATAGSNSPICVGSTLNLTANTVAGATYGWTGPNSFTSALQNPSITSATVAASGAYTLTITEGACVETDVVQVVVNPLPVVTISANGLALTASLAGATYKWINCADDTPITGATAQTFVATANGSYKVEVTDANGCVATSSCSAISTVGVEAKTGVDSFSLSPNPTKGKVTITTVSNETANVVIFNALGKEVSKANNIQNGSVIDFTSFNNGVYMVQISTEKGTKVQRVVKN